MTPLVCTAPTRQACLRLHRSHRTVHAVRQTATRMRMRCFRLVAGRGWLSCAPRHAHAPLRSLSGRASEPRIAAAAPRSSPESGVDSQPCGRRRATAGTNVCMSPAVANEGTVTPMGEQCPGTASRQSTRLPGFPKGAAGPALKRRAKRASGGAAPLRMPVARTARLPCKRRAGACPATALHKPARLRGEQTPRCTALRGFRGGECRWERRW